MQSKELRAIRVTYDNGDVIETSTASGLTDEEMLDYFKAGTEFNIGVVVDKMAKVTNVEILR